MKITPRKPTDGKPTASTDDVIVATAKGIEAILSPVPPPPANTLPDGTPEPMTEDEIREAWAMVANSDIAKVLDVNSLAVKEAMGKLLSRRLTPEVIGVNAVEAAELLQMTIRAATKLANDASVPQEIRINAVRTAANAASVQVELSKYIAHAYQSMPGKRPWGVAPPMSQPKNRGPSPDRPIIVAQNVQINNRDSVKTGEPQQGESTKAQ